MRLATGAFSYEQPAFLLFSLAFGYDPRWDSRDFSLAFAITGTRWNGPKFFGLRDKPSKEARS
jgi:hypothetical protein